jgi:hypothetical protein
MFEIFCGIEPEKLLYERSRDIRFGICREIPGGIGPEKLLLDRSRLVMLEQFKRP